MENAIRIHRGSTIPLIKNTRGDKMSDAMKKESVIVSDALIGTFDILGATAIYAADEKDAARNIASLIIRAISESINEPIHEMQSYYEKKIPNGGRLNELIKRTSSYIYADTIVFTCDVSEFDLIMMRFATEYFQYMGIEITRRMFALGLPIRGCLNCGITARYNDDNKIVVSGKAYVDALKIADRLEFSGTVITEELYKVIQESQRAIDYPPMQYSLNLPCVVKDKSKKGCVTQDMWCLDWLDDTEFLKDHADVQQLIFNIFASHGKVVRDSVNNKIGNTENNIRLLISHRNGSRSPCAALS